MHVEVTRTLGLCRNGHTAAGQLPMLHSCHLKHSVVPYPVSPSFLIFLTVSTSPPLVSCSSRHLKDPLPPSFVLTVIFLAVTVTSELHMQLDAVRCPSCSRPHPSNLQTSNNNDIGSSHYLCPQSISLEAGSSLTVIQTKLT